jgi:penicillin-insensitive murein DD-endopeptidase
MDGGLEGLMRVPQMLLALVVATASAGVLAINETAAITASANKKVKKVKKVKKAKKHPGPSGPLARELFAAATTPAPMAARAIGFYAKGCLAGGVALPIDGQDWQVMRLSRNRNWGHPDLVALVERLAADAKQHDGWPGLLVGDIAQPRGGPMRSDHASHQVGLDADIWLTPMPDHRLSEREREDLRATSMVAADHISVDPNVWSDAQVRLLRRAASYAEVQRIFVNPAIKKALCDAVPKDADRAWLHKVRAYWGHESHFHLRIGCPKDSAGCISQPALPNDDDGCGQELSNWLALVKKPPRPEPPPALGASAPSRRGITLDQLPAECRVVLDGGAEGKPASAGAPTATAAAVAGKDRKK